MQAWDVAGRSEKLRQKRYDFSDSEVKRYFPEDAVLGGLFRVIETLYGVRVRPSRAVTWHPDVKFYAIEDAQGAAGGGQFYLDLTPARPSAAAPGWPMRATAAGSPPACRTPVTFLALATSPAPVGGQPAFFTHGEVTTLFHELRHGLHQLLTAHRRGRCRRAWRASSGTPSSSRPSSWRTSACAAETQWYDPRMSLTRAVLALLLAAALGAAQAQQQLYRWVDAKGKVHVTDTPPPATARKVEKKTYGSSATPAPSSFELDRVRERISRDAVYGAGSCKEPCAQARAALNQRGVPYKEVQVWNEATNAQLKTVSQSNEVPVLSVGRSVQKGFEQRAYDNLLDSAGYPRTGTLPATAQAAPPAPTGYIPPEKRATQPTPSA